MASYTSTELSYLLAGRDGERADFARAALGLTELQEGDAAVAAGAQALVSRGRASIENGVVAIGDEAKFIGYTLGTATDWLRISMQTEKDDEGIIAVAMAFVGSRRGEPAIAMQILPLGNIEIGIVEPTATISEAAHAVVAGYLRAYDTVAVALQRDAPEVRGTLGFARSSADGLRLLHRTTVPGFRDLAHPDVEPADLDTVLLQFDALASATAERAPSGPGGEASNVQ